MNLKMILNLKIIIDIRNLSVSDPSAHPTWAVKEKQNAQSAVKNASVAPVDPNWIGLHFIYLRERRDLPLRALRRLRRVRRLRPPDFNW